MHTILFDCPCHLFCSGPLSICLRVSHVGAWGLVGSHLGLAQCTPTFSAITYQFLSILGDPSWETTCLLGPSFWCLHFDIGGPHTKSTLTTNITCAKPYVFCWKCDVALPHVTATATDMFELWATTCTSVWGLTTQPPTWWD